MQGQRIIPAESERVDTPGSITSARALIHKQSTGHFSRGRERKVLGPIILPIASFAHNFAASNTNIGNRRD